jgi:uncharacterized membrane protein
VADDADISVAYLVAGVVAALTAERGLVTVQTVLAVQPAADNAQRPC